MMEKIKLIFLGLFLFVGSFKSTDASAGATTWSLTFNRPCTAGIIEESPISIQTLSEEIKNGILHVYKGVKSDATGKVYKLSVTIDDIYCLDGNIIAKTSVNYNTTDTAATFNKVFNNQIRMKNSTSRIINDVKSADFNAKPGKFTRNVDLFAELDGSLRGTYFCDNSDNFKKRLAETLILKDGISKAHHSQIVFSNHPCGKKGADRAMFKDIQFYVSVANKIDKVDVALTTLAFRIVEQMIYDGTEWRLGLVLHKYLDSIKLMGFSKPDFGYSEFEITYIGFGALLGLIVLIILIVLLVRCARSCCCPNCCGRDEKDFVPVQIEPKDGALFQTAKVPTEVAQVVNYDIHSQTNPAYETVTRYDYGDAPRYDDVVPPVVVTQGVREEVEPEYFELKAVSEIPEPAPVMNTFQEPEPIEVDEVDIEPVYDNPVESTPMESELLPGDADTISIDSDIVEGRDLNVDDLANALAFESGLADEFDIQANRFPAAMLYPDDVASKNRIPNSFPWPESRVPLGVNNPSGDYINASFVRDNNGALAYIATQGPMENTTKDFWTMVMERNVSVIVMATPLTLKGQEMCHQYWPRDQKLYSYGNVKVQLSRKELKPDFLVMRVTAYIDEDTEPRSISIYRYMSWPSSDIPGNAKSIVAFLLEIREVCENLEELPLFHCSSGRGMSAVLIALWNGMLSIEERNVANVEKIIHSLRKDLPGAIESYDQYKFLYQVLLQYAQFNAT